MVGCMSSFLVNHYIMLGDVAKNTQYLVSQGFSEEHIKAARVAWTCVTDSIVSRDLLGRVFAAKSPTVVLGAEFCVIGSCHGRTGQVVGSVRLRKNGEGRTHEILWSNRQD